MKQPAVLAAITLLAPFALLGSAKAWQPDMTPQTARQVIDGVYQRSAPVTTLLSIDLTVEGGQFASGENAVTVYETPQSCVSDWLSSPSDFSQSSRPSAVIVTGQADEILLAAQEARARLRSLQPEAALAREDRLPAGHLRVYVTMQGLEREELRDAYIAVLQNNTGEFVQPYRRAFLGDWKQEGGFFGGTMLYYFDAAGAGIGGSDKINLLLRTESELDCVYAVPLDLSKFM